MKDLIVPSIVECPLCLHPMKKFVDKGEVFFVCIGKNCMLSINVVDPALNKWKVEKPPECPSCRTPMRMFFRALDRYSKTQCPKCTAKGRMVQVVRERVPADQNWSVEP